VTDVDERVRPAAARPPARPSLTGRAVVLALVVVTLLVSLAVPVRSWFAQRAQIAGLREDVTAARERVAALELQKQRWEDPNFVAAEARRRLHFVLPGEVGYVTLGSRVTDGSVEAAAPDQPWLTTLWGALQEADTPTDLSASVPGKGNRAGSTGDASQG
jgi:cell division protein FtsB